MADLATSTSTPIEHASHGSPPSLSPDGKGKQVSRYDARRRALREQVPPSSTLAQFSFGPATQTTVVTTTTTTTTKFPHFVMPSTRHARLLDPRQYPLAQSPTPSALKNMAFVLGEQSITFREATDVDTELDQLARQQSLLERRKGVIRHVTTSAITSARRNPSSMLSPRVEDERLASPDSIPDWPIQSEVTPASDRRTSPSARRSVQVLTGAHPRLRAVRDRPPVTPGTRSRHTQRLNTQERASHNVLPSPALDDHSHIQPISIQQDLDTDMQSFTDERRTISRGSYDSAVPTPPVDSPDRDFNDRSLDTRALSSIPARLQMSQSPSVQDGTLPSPSLSPVTTSTAMQHDEYFTDFDSASDNSSRRSYQRELWNHHDDRALHGRYGSPAMTDNGFSDDDDEAFPAHDPQSLNSVRDIPNVLNYFESLPNAMKSYLMHQLLRRCPRKTLQVVADVVNPVLKCDFLTLLPPELGIQIVRYLDVKSLCQAAQVSTRWRRMINSDEKAWKELFDADGFYLADGELQQAIAQGWGWQDPAGPAGRELDLSTVPFSAHASEAGSPGPSTKKPTFFPSLRRSKRKAATQLTNRGKPAKRQARSREPSIDPIVGDWMSQLSTSEGPNNAANAAVIAVPNPELELPSLKGLHLYKSLYRRHHLIRRNWMTEETTPHHLAFKAHGSHVVTCLQFDTDKILTGSDDSNINVYETKSGKLRKLLRGHQGGVWALQYVGNTLVSGSTDRSVRVWDIDAGLETHVFRGHTSTVRCLQILQPTKVGTSSDGKPIMMPKQPLIITGSRDSTLRIWRLPKPTDPNHIQAENDGETEESPYFVRSLTGHQHSVRAIAAHADVLVSGSYDTSVRVWKISTGETVHRLHGHATKVYSVVLDHKRNRCISGSMDFLVKIWSLETGSALYTLEGHTSLVGLLDLNCDRLVSAAADTTLRIWDPENGQCKAILRGHTGAITCFQHDAQKVISGSEKTLKMWDMKTGKWKKDLLSDLSGVWQVKFNDRRCVAAVQRGTHTFIEVLDFGAARDGVPEKDRGRRMVVDEAGRPVEDDDDYDREHEDDLQALHEAIIHEATN